MAEAKERLGYIGLGFMGGPMALRLVRAGFPLTVWNRSPAKTDRVVVEGAKRARSPAEVARDGDIVFTCLSDTEAVEAVVFGKDGIAEGAAAGKLLVDFSSIRPEATVAMAERLRRETGMGWIDAPVSGGVPGAEQGTLAVMAGGAEADFERVRAVVGHLARRFTLMGPNGAGQTTKLVNQVIVACTTAVIAEATALALAAGLEVDRVPAALAGGRADSLPLQQWMPKMARGDRTPESSLETMMKDLDTVQALARATGTAMPMTGLASELHRLLIARGHGRADSTALMMLYRKEPV